jgi:hypothetical protein
MKRKVSDLIASFFEQKGVKHAFGIIGSANAHIFDSIFHQSNIELVCNHHEQACTMAVQTYWKITGVPTFALVTAGAGSSNAITGVLSAWADSIPCLILSGQENARYITPDHAMRLYGIQGYDSPFAVSKMTKYAARVMQPEQVLYELEKAWHHATTGRPGPCWLDFPMNVQAAQVETDDLPHSQPDATGPAARARPRARLRAQKNAAPAATSQKIRSGPGRNAAKRPNKFAPLQASRTQSTAALATTPDHVSPPRRIPATTSPKVAIGTKAQRFSHPFTRPPPRPAPGAPAPAPPTTSPTPPPTPTATAAETRPIQPGSTPPRPTCATPARPPCRASGGSRARRPPPRPRPPPTPTFAPVPLESDPSTTVTAK